MNENNEDKLNEIIFFFGAGASAQAGVPTTFDFVKEFNKHLSKEREDLLPFFEEIRNILTENKIMGKEKGVPPDIELVYEFLNRIKNHDKELILIIHKDYESLISEYSQKPVDYLIDELKDYIKLRTHVPQKAIEYLGSFRKFFVSDSVINEVYTTNYDDVIEQFCSQYNIKYTDGFDLYWNINNFEKKDNELLIFKIHGSLGWFQTSSGKFIKSTIIMDKTPSLTYTGEEINDVIVYPMQKWERPGPLLDLIYKLKRRLNSQKTKLVFSVGYSFRDDYIKQLFIESLKNNRELHLVIISPSAVKIKKDLLEDQSMISDLEERIICYPSYFEHILPDLYDFSRYLKTSIDLEKRSREREITGDDPDWYSTLYHFERAAHFLKMYEIIKEDNTIINRLSLFDKIRITLILSTGLRSVDLDESANEMEWILYKLLMFILDTINIEMNPMEVDNQKFFTYDARFDYIDMNGNMSSDVITINKINSIQVELKKYDFLQKMAKRKFVKSDVYTRQLKLFELLDNLQEYFVFWDIKQKIYSKILERHRNYADKFEIDLILNENKDDLKQIVRNNEIKILEKITQNAFEDIRIPEERKVIIENYWKLNQYKKTKLT